MYIHIAGSHRPDAFARIESSMWQPLLLRGLRQTLFRCFARLSQQYQNSRPSCACKRGAAHTKAESSGSEAPFLVASFGGVILHGDRSTSGAQGSPLKRPQRKLCDQKLRSLPTEFLGVKTAAGTAGLAGRAPAMRRQKRGDFGDEGDLGESTTLPPSPAPKSSIGSIARPR